MRTEKGDERGRFREKRKDRYEMKVSELRKKRKKKEGMSRGREKERKNGMQEKVRGKER